MAFLEALADCLGPVGEQGHDGMQGRGFGSDGNRDRVRAHRFPTMQATTGLTGRRMVERSGSIGRLQRVNNWKGTADCPPQMVCMTGTTDWLDQTSSSPALSTWNSLVRARAALTAIVRTKIHPSRTVAAARGSVHEVRTT